MLASEDCLLNRKNTSLEITKTLEIKNVVLLVMKNIWNLYNSFNKSAKIRSSKLFQCCSNAFEKYWNNNSTIFLKVISRTRDIVHWEYRDFPFQCGRYVQALIVFRWFFLQPTQQAKFASFQEDIHDFYIIFSCHHDLFTFQKFCTWVDDTFLVPNEPHDNRWRDSNISWSKVLHEESFICI